LSGYVCRILVRLCEWDTCQVMCVGYLSGSVCGIKIRVASTGVKLAPKNLG
jgi:hypothetical protein